MKTLVVLNDPACGIQRSYNGLRLAPALAKPEGEQVRIFLLADAVSCALAGQKTPNGYHNLELRQCMDARAIREDQLVQGSRRPSLDELTDWTLWADKVITF